MDWYCLAITRKNQRCRLKRYMISCVLCYKHFKLYNKRDGIHVHLLDIINYVVEVFENKLSRSSLWLCNKDLYIQYIKQTKCYQYFIRGDVNNTLLPSLMLFIPNDCIMTTMANTLWYLVICHSGKEYFLSTHESLINLLTNMHERFDKVSIYPYLDNKTLGFYVPHDYNYAYIHDVIQEYPLDD